MFGRGRQRGEDGVKCQAEAAKTEGNTLFKKEKYRAAVEKYTEAITLRPDWAVPIVNRALCHKRLGRWEQVESDARVAVGLQADNVKALFYLGQAMFSLGKLIEAVPVMSRALEAARTHHDGLKDDIWQELARLKYAVWEAESKRRQERMASAQERIAKAMAALREAERREAEAAGNTDGAAAAERASYDDECIAEVFDQAAARDQPGEPAGAFCCQLTMDVFREPVMTPSGISYEASALNEHLKKVGMWDPVTRQPIASMDELIVNTGLRAATQQYLEDHPWAWRDIYD